VFDPLEARAIYDIGFIGGVDRGISLGHFPRAGNQGSVAGLSATAGMPVNPANFVYVIPSSAVDPAFPGPEVQYLETGAAEAAIIGASPAGPIFTVDIHLDGAEEGDVFDFYLLDFIVVWSGGQHGAFSTKGPISLDTGGDAVPDSTRTLHGVDADSSIAVPPAAFLVDFIDGGETPGPATITVVGPIGTGGAAPSRLAEPVPRDHDARVRSRGARLGTARSLRRRRTDGSRPFQRFASGIRALRRRVGRSERGREERGPRRVHRPTGVGAGSRDTPDRAGVLKPGALESGARPRDAIRTENPVTPGFRDVHSRRRILTARRPCSVARRAT
jgi:hypothetical protein